MAERRGQKGRRTTPLIGRSFGTNREQDMRDLSRAMGIISSFVKFPTPIGRFGEGGTMGRMPRQPGFGIDLDDLFFDLPKAFKRARAILHDKRALRGLDKQVQKRLTAVRKTTDQLAQARRVPQGRLAQRVDKGVTETLINQATPQRTQMLKEARERFRRTLRTLEDEDDFGFLQAMPRLPKKVQPGRAKRLRTARQARERSQRVRSARKTPEQLRGEIEDSLEDMFEPLGRPLQSSNRALIHRMKLETKLEDQLEELRMWDALRRDVRGVIKERGSDTFRNVLTGAQKRQAASAVGIGVGRRFMRGSGSPVGPGPAPVPLAGPEPTPTPRPARGRAVRLR